MSGFNFDDSGATTERPESSAQIVPGENWIRGAGDDVRTKLTATWLNSVKANLTNLVVGLGGDPLDGDNQLLNAIKSAVLPHSKFDANGPPTTSDDGANTSGRGVFKVRSKWYDQVSKEVWECLDNGTGEAVWVNTSFSVEDLGTAAAFNVGPNPNNIVQLDGAGKLPAADGSQLLNLPGGGVTNDSVDTVHIKNQAITANKIADGVILPSQGKNLLINGNFDVWQRGTSHSTQGYGSADRWYMHLSGATCSFSRQEFALGQSDVPNNPKYFGRWAITVSDDYTGLYQRVENVKTLAGETATVSFWARHVTNRGTALAVSLAQDFGSGGSPSSVVYGTSQSFTTTTDWQKFELTFNLSSILGKTIGTNGDDNLRLMIQNSTNEIFDLDIAQVKLESGGTATGYGYEDPTETLLKCKRYYNEDGVDSGNPLIGWMPDINGSEARAILYTYPVDMLYPPTVTATGDFTITVNNVKEGSCWLSTTAPSPAYGVALYKIILESEL